MRSLFLTTPFLFISMLAMAQGPASFHDKYPDTKKVDQVDSFFGTMVSDPYRWLENDMSQETKDWVVEENKVTNSYLSKIPFRDSIKHRLEKLWNYEKYTSPFHEGEYTYFYKNSGLQNQFVLYRQKGNLAPEVFLDPNKFSKDGTTSLAGIDFSQDGSLAAYQVSEGGSDWRKVIVIDTKTKKKIGDTLFDVKFSAISWLFNEGFYYSSYDKPKEGSLLAGKTQFHKLYYHKMGTKQSEDTLIFGGEDMPRRYISGSVTEDQHYLIISAANSTTGNELYVQNLTVKGAPILPVVTGFDNSHDVIDEFDDRLFIVTNQGAPNSKMISVAAANPTYTYSSLIIPEGEFPLSATSCSGRFFAHYLKDAVSAVVQYAINGTKQMEIVLPGLGTAAGFSGKSHDKEIYYTFTSYKDPLAIYKYDPLTGASDLFKKPQFSVDLSRYVSQQLFYTSKDGTKIPMIITFSKTALAKRRGEPGPLMLYGYGGFNVNLTPAFSVSNVVFMENGGIYAVANLRGGGEYGEKWHEAGTKMNKQNVFDDFISAAEFLIENKFTSRELLAISGGSNGGLLIGACMTQRPDLFKVCFPAVGVMDMLRYHKFTTGAGWASDYGTADDSKQMFDYLHKYSPVHNVRKSFCYPATMVTTADHDDRVVPAHSFKFAAALQAAQSCAKPILINIETKAGHGAGKPTSMIIQEQADKWAFLFWNMGISYTAGAATGPSHGPVLPIKAPSAK